MLKQFFVSLILLLLVICRGSMAAPLTYAPAVKKAAPSVVNVYILRQASRGTAYSRRSATLRPILKQRLVLGSGVIMDPRGYILTNSHVVRDRSHILVSLSDGRAIRAKLVGMDSETDLAVIKIDLKNLPVIAVGNSDKLQVGDVVLAIGNPFGLGSTVTQGIISALGRTAVGLSNIENFIQTDVALNPGSSGGALINTQGQLIGINTGIYTRSGGYQGVSFAIPVNAANSVLQQIIVHGKVSRGWLGLEVVNLDPLLAYDLKTKLTQGVVVEKIARKSPAYHQLKPNDIITQVNQRKIRKAQNFMSNVAQRMPGNTIELTLYRNHVKKIVTIILGSRPEGDNLWRKVTIDGKSYKYPDDRF